VTPGRDNWQGARSIQCRVMGMMLVFNIKLVLNIKVFNIKRPRQQAMVEARQPDKRARPGGGGHQHCHSSVVCAAAVLCWYNISGSYWCPEAVE
jgi:hypothetical protein